MAEEGFFAEVDGKLWSSSYNQQRRPDTARVGAVIPKDRLVVKKARYFTTDTSQTQLQQSWKAPAAAQPDSATPPPKKFSPKNA